jgi:sugar lactone lactonase YvrE
MANRVPRTLATDFSFLEAPRWHRGRLYASDFYTHRVLAFDEDGSFETLCSIPHQPSGLGFLPDGSLLIVSMIDRRIVRLLNGVVEPYADLGEVASFHCNDMAVDAAGNAYVGNFGWDPAIEGPVHTARLALIRPDRSVTAVGGDLVFPNGMVLTGDGRLLVAETFASRITAYDRAPDGTLTGGRPWATLGPSHASIAEVVAGGAPLPDGMTLDAEGALWIGDAGGRAALRIAEGGAILDRVETGDLTVFATALGGADGRTLFLCASPPLRSHDPSIDRRAVLLACKVDVPAA